MAIHTRKKADGSTIYSAAFFAPDGRRRVVEVRTVPPKAPQRDHKLAREAASLAATQHRANVRNGEWQDPSEAKPERRLSFETLASLFLAEHDSPHYQHRVKAAVDHFGTKPADQITTMDVERYRDTRSKQSFGGRRLQPETVRKDLTVLASMFTWARRKRLVRFEVNPAGADMVTRPARTKPNPRPLSVAEEALLLEHSPPWLSRIIRWAIYSGMDRSEITTLSWHDVNEADGIVSAPRAKTGEPRTVFLNRPLREVLAEARKVRSVTTPRVFLGRESEPVTPNAVNLCLRRVYRRAGLAEEHPFKRFRHTFGSRVAQSGASEFEVMGLLGHSSPDMARHYVRMANAQLRTRAEQLGESAAHETAHENAQVPSKTAQRAAHNVNADRVSKVTR